MSFINRYRIDHLAFWLITTFFYGYLNRAIADSVGMDGFVANVLLHTVLLAVVCYLNIFVLFQHLFKAKRYPFYFVGVLTALGLYAFLQGLIDNYFAGPGPQTLHRFYYNFSIGFFYVAFTLSLVLSKRWYTQNLLLHQVRAEKLNAELRYLKAQLNPHFLFNSLNTIYFQIDSSNSEARESLQKFSELLRYQLYESNADKIPIEKEIAYVTGYVDLQRLRRNSRYNIRLSVSESVQDFSIAPLLLLPFVENAFKHLSAFTDRENTVDITFCRKGNGFYFTVMNTFSGKQQVCLEPGGIGLQNVKRRLELLYQGNYDLAINQSQDEFVIKLLVQP
ncbi:MAG: histidine kinase [Flavitalea sp.]